VIQRRFAVGFGEDIGVLPAAIVVLVLALMNFLVGVGEPHHPIWDESYYLTAIARYEHGTTQFASHPPLGIMLLTGGDLLLHPNRALDTSRVGWDKQIADEKLPPHYSFTGIRFLSGVFAVLGALLFFAVMRALTGSPVRAVLFSCLYLFENAFIAHFRAAQLDAFQVCFEIAAVLCLVLAAQRASPAQPGRGTLWLDLGFGAAVGLATMVKLNAIVLAPLGGMLVLWRIGLSWDKVPRGRLLLTGLRDSLVMAAGCFIMVSAVFTAHVVAGKHPPVVASPAGEKDAGFLTPRYWAYLRGDRWLSPMVVMDASLDYWRFMQSDLKGMPMTDPNGSKPLVWPLHIGAINYRWDKEGDHTAYVQLAGNVWSWWIALAALLATPVLLVMAIWQQRKAEQGTAPGKSPVSPQPWRRAVMLMLLLQYLIYMGVHAYLGSMRVMYLYHYFIALVLSFCLVPLVLAEASERWAALKARQDGILSVLVVGMLASFAFYSPLSFHRPMTKAHCEWRNVVQHIVKCQ
jgi:dolichyl-phosphate-mannose--protein O-mannosyl transferase